MDMQCKKCYIEKKYFNKESSEKTPSMRQDNLLQIIPNKQFFAEQETLMKMRSGPTTHPAIVGKY